MKIYASCEFYVIFGRVKNTLKDALKPKFQNVTPYVQIQEDIEQ